MGSQNQSSDFCNPVETSQTRSSNSCNPMDTVAFADDVSIIEEKDIAVDVFEPEHEDGAADTKKKKKKKKKESSKIVEEKPISVKKIPKHVLLIQERQSKLREAGERRKREEEERLRKEEEERIKQEEDEEKKWSKKEREKEKLRKKKEEGKLLTEKQKEKARKLEAVRDQLLANANFNLSAAKTTPYQNKKSKPQAQSNGAAISEPKEIQQDDVSEEVDSVVCSSLHEVVDVVDDEEWDAKSWDGADLKLQDFGDEIVVSEREPLPKKVMPRKTENVVIEGDGKNKKVDKTVKQDIAKPDDHPLRSPICCVMGHVDAGKTKLLDCIRRTNVQEGEAGGITQQIGATYFPAENIRDRTKGLKADAKLNVPGLLVIDTPGHESFTNLRSRGSGLCDIAVLVVDIMHGLEPQTIESLNLLKEKKTDFIVALNKVDRLYGWKTCRDAPIREAIRQQSKDVKNEFNMRITQVITQFKEQGLNSELYYKNREMGETYNIVPTSATSGEGIPNLLLLLVQGAQKTMVKWLTYSEQVQCSVLEVKVVEGHGTTIDVVLVNGVLHEGDQIVVCGMQGPIVTTIRALLTPHPMRELRVKGTYLHHKDIKAAQGIKIVAQGLEHTIAGTCLYVLGLDDDIEGIKEAAMEDVNSVISRIDKSGVGVYVQASTLGSLEALLEFLKTPAVNIPGSAISLGPVHKKNVMKASVMLEKKKEYGTILAFDTKVTPEARELADVHGVTILYHLFDQFKIFIDNLKEKRKREAAEAVFPCKLKPNHVYNKKDPILLRVEVTRGIAKVGTPVCAYIDKKDLIDIGRIASIQDNQGPVDCAKKGQHVAIKIIGSNPEEQRKMFGRHFEMKDELVSQISRKSLSALKENYADDLSTEEISLLFELKKLFKIL